MWCSVRFDLGKYQAPRLGGHQHRSSSIAVVQNSYSNNMVVSIVQDITDDAEGHETVWQTWLLTENCLPCYLHRILGHDKDSLHNWLFCKTNITLTTDPLQKSLHTFVYCSSLFLTCSHLHICSCSPRVAHNLKQMNLHVTCSGVFPPCKIWTADSLVQYSCMYVNCMASLFCLNS